MSQGGLAGWLAGSSARWLRIWIISMKGLVILSCSLHHFFVVLCSCVVTELLQSYSRVVEMIHLEPAFLKHPAVLLTKPARKLVLFLIIGVCVLLSFQNRDGIAFTSSVDYLHLLFLLMLHSHQKFMTSTDKWLSDQVLL